MAAGQVRYPIRLRSRMLPSDALFWFAEETMPELRPLVAGLFLLDQAPDRERLHAALQRLTVWVPRLRQRVVEPALPAGLPEWEDEPNFELGYHLREVVLPEPATRRHLLDFIGVLFASPVDPLRPLWESYLIEGLEGGGAAFFFKGHHAVVDGVGSLALFDALTQSHRDEPVRAPREPRVRTLGSAERLFRGLVETVSDAGAILESGVRAALQPEESARRTLRALAGLRGVIRDVTTGTIRDPLAKRCTGIGRRLDVLTLSLPRLRRIKEMLDATLNDLVLTVLAGALGRYYDECECHVEELHCVVPMSVRTEEDKDTLGNRVGMFIVTLPVAIREPLLRLELIRKQTRAAKADRRGAVYPLLLHGLTFVPNVAFRALTRRTAGHVNLICTNVPGPRTRRYLAGARIEEIFPFAPVMLGTPLSVALLSYADAYAVGIDMDPGAIPDAGRLSALLEQGIAELEERVQRSANEPA